MEGFEAQTQTISIKSGEMATAYFALISNSEETEDWYKTHEDDQALLEQITGAIYEQKEEAYVAENGIVKNLPYRQSFGLYTIGYGTCSETIEEETEEGLNYNEISYFCITIDADAGYRTAAVDYFAKELGDPGEYHFSFYKYANPFWPNEAVEEGSYDAG